LTVSSDSFQKFQAYGLSGRVHNDADGIASDLLFDSEIGSALAFAMHLQTSIIASALMVVPNNPPEFFEGFEGSFGWSFGTTI
jgi:hypothetical protein